MGARIKVKSVFFSSETIPNEIELVGESREMFGSLGEFNYSKRPWHTGEFPGSLQIVSPSSAPRISSLYALSFLLRHL